jgi:hypothetical protein
MKRREDVHRAWAPAEATWSPWVKPVLFAHLDEEVEPRPLPSSPSWLRGDVIAPLVDAATPGDRGGHPYRADARLRDVAVVVDLPGVAGTQVGVALADFGFRAVPLYNAVPSSVAVVDLYAVMATLVDAADKIAALPPDAPPAFLLDADRATGVGPIAPGRFDNRSFCRESDFPSAEALLRAGVRRVVVVQRAPLVADDLEATLFHWQTRGLGLWGKVVGDERPATPLVFRRRMWPYRLVHGVRRALLRPRADAAYGRMIPSPTGG